MTANILARSAGFAETSPWMTRQTVLSEGHARPATSLMVRILEYSNRTAADLTGYKQLRFKLKCLK
jgi:hypothetical protein